MGLSTLPPSGPAPRAWARAGARQWRGGGAAGPSGRFYSPRHVACFVAVSTLTCAVPLPVDWTGGTSAAPARLALYATVAAFAQVNAAAAATRVITSAVLRMIFLPDCTFLRPRKPSASPSPRL